jgi:hypothetical protein
MLALVTLALPIETVPNMLDEIQTIGDCDIVRGTTIRSKSKGRVLPSSRIYSCSDVFTVKATSSDSMSCQHVRQK